MQDGQCLVSLLYLLNCKRQGMMSHTYNLASWEVEIGRIKIQGQSRQKVIETLISNQLDMLVHTYNPSYTGSVCRRIMILGCPQEKM
jgi:hypothetical protein